ncbi:hypothetical protein IPH25_00510 [bacterium]|nr:MAG: hypothetical protein IPG37_02625 [bacterium]QQR61916.1 MAG: hypothetical protein IPH25_00510 [bacterium]QQR62495.1 MAG: hypothetical protein IPH67_03680 [bacterium]
MDKAVFFTNFVALVEFDNKIKLCKKSIAEEIQKIATLQNELVEYQTSVEDAKKQSTTLQQKVNFEENLLAEISKKIKALHTTINNLQAYKDYHALKQEFDLLCKQQVDQEQIVANTWDAFEIAEKNYKNLLISTANTNKLLEENMSVSEQKKAQLEGDLRNLYEQRPTYEVNIPQEWLNKYATMQSKVENPIVTVENGQCASCFYQLTGTDVQAIKKGALVQCKNCFRLLYGSHN